MRVMKATTIDYEKLIRKAFPNAQIEYIENFNDLAAGWLISPSPGNLIVFKFYTSNDLYLIIERYTVIPDIMELKYAKLFQGYIPADDNYEPDEDFIVKILKNYELIGSTNILTRN